MLQSLAQTTYTYTTTSSDDAAAVGFLAGTMLLVMLLVFLPLLIFYIVCLWKVFEKAGVEGWKAIVPVYNGWVLAEIAGKPGWWGIVGIAGFIPVVGVIASIVALVLYVLICIELSKKFGKDPIFSLLLIFVSFVGFAILAFGKASYRASAGGSSKPAAPVKA